MLNGNEVTERTFRIFLGAGLFLLLYISAFNDDMTLLYFYIGLLVFEGLTNWRLPKILTLLKQPAHQNTSFEDFAETPPPQSSARIPFDAEQAMRLVLAMLLLTPVFFSAEILWVVPWFVASMLLLAGLTNICPMVMFFRWLGFR